MLLGSPLVMSGWWVRSLLPASVSFEHYQGGSEGDEGLGVVPGGG